MLVIMLVAPRCFPEHFEHPVSEEASIVIFLKMISHRECSKWIRIEGMGGHISSVISPDRCVLGDMETGTVEKFLSKSNEQISLATNFRVRKRKFRMNFSASRL